MTEHTALPLRVRMHRQIVDANNNVVAVCENPATERARFIVAACNCHADLLEALKDIAGYTGNLISDDAYDMQGIAEKAIRKAEETP